jgi:hypothetical protein
MHINFAKQSYQSEFGREAQQVSNVAISDTKWCAIDIVDKKSEGIDFDERRYCVRGTREGRIFRKGRASGQKMETANG